MIVVTGSLALDYIMDFPGVFSDHIMPDKIHSLNLSFLVNTLKKQNGGTAGNIAYSLALLKKESALLATAGEDFNHYLSFLQNNGVNISSVKIIPGELTASAFIMTDKNDNQITGFYPGAMAKSNELSLKGLGTKPTFVVISASDPSAMVKLSDEAIEMGISYMLDPGMQLPRLEPLSLAKMVSNAEVLIGNDYEIDLLKNKLNMTDYNLSERVKIVITTFGKLGSQIKSNNETIKIEPLKTDKAADPTGAGDAYRSGFLAGYTNKLPLKTCGQMGSTAACYAIETYGTTTHTYTLDQFKKRYKENFGEELEF